MASGGSGAAMQGPNYTKIGSDVNLADAFRRLAPMTDSITRQFVTACETLNVQRQQAKVELDRNYDQLIHRQTTREKLLNYWHQIAAPPISDLRQGELAVSYYWKDGLNYARAFKDKSGVLEKSNIIYNIGVSSAWVAIEIFKGKNSADRLAKAKKHFEEAAGAFQKVKDMLKHEERQIWRDPSKVNMEMRPEALDAMISVMLAYALTCFYEKAVEDGKSDSLLVKVAHQVAAAYNAASGRMQEAVLAKKGLDRWLSGWQQFLDFESKYYMAQASIHAASECQSKTEPAKQLAHLTAAKTGLDNVYRASNSTSSKTAGAGKMIKARRPTLLQELNKLQADLSTLEKDIRNMVYGQQHLVDPSTVEIPAASAIQVVPKDFDSAFQREAPLLFDGIIFEAGRVRRAPVPHPDITSSSEEEIEDEADNGSPEQTEDESNQVAEEQNAPVFGATQPARIQEEIIEELEVDAGRNNGEPARITEIEFEIDRSRINAPSSRVSAVDPSQNNGVARPSSLTAEEDIPDEVGPVGALSPARAPGRDAGLVIGGKGAVIDDDEEGDDPAARSEQVRRDALRASVEREAERARQRRDAEWQAEQQRRQAQIEEERLAAQAAQLNVQPAAVQSGADSRERRRLAEAVQSALPQETTAVNQTTERVPPSTPAARSTQQRQAARADDLSRLKPGDVAAPGYLFGGKANGIPFYVCQATGQSVWELPSSTHLAAVMATMGRGRANLRPGDRVAPNYVFGGYSSGLPFYVQEDTGQSVWELPAVAAEQAAPAVQDNRASGASQSSAVASNQQPRPLGANQEGSSARSGRSNEHRNSSQSNGVWGPGSGSAAPRPEMANNNNASDRRSQEDIDREMAERLTAEWAAEENARVEQADNADVQRQQEDLNWLQEQVRQQAGRPQREEPAPANANRGRKSEEEKKKEEELKKKAEQVRQMEEKLRRREAELQRKAKELEEEKKKREEEAASSRRTNSSEDTVPNEYLCPITMDIMKDPVLAMDGHSYERSAIENWLRRNQKSPKTNALLPSKMLISNHALKSMIIEWLEKNPQHQ